MYLLSMLPKFFLALIILLAYVKISGKSQIAPMSQLDQVGSMVIGALVGGSLLAPNVSTLDAVGVVIIWSALLVTIRFIKSKSEKLRNLIDGRPIQLVKNGQLLSCNFSKAKLTVRDFETLLNVNGIMSFHQLKHVWYELNGSLTIIKKGDKNISYLLIENGRINEENLSEINQTEAWLHEELKKSKHDNIEDVFCAEWSNEKLYVYLKDEIRKKEVKKK